MTTDKIASVLSQEFEKNSEPRRLILILLGFATALLVSVTFRVAYAETESRIYGVILTNDGEEFEGFIRWDKNEVGWDNILDGTKDRPRIRNRHSSRRKNRGGWLRSLFGSSFVSGKSSQSGVSFGYLERLEPDGENAVILTLKGGDELELRYGSTDIGTDVREILIEDNTQGEIELEWDDIELITFSSPTDGAVSRSSSSIGKDEVRRIFGTVTTRRRDKFTGFIGWDYDESLSSDILDGYVSGRKRKVRFEDIASIERRGRSGSIVITRKGKKIRMEDSNDVDDRNNGIVISDPSLGRIVVQWDEFDRLDLTDPPLGRSYESYTPVRPLYGAVITEDDEKLVGEIIWDADEAYSWELLDGEFRDVSLSIVFENVASIEKVSRGARVKLRDGREFRLRNSNDIDGDNKGIFVAGDDGEYEEVRWDDFVRVDFSD